MIDDLVILFSTMMCVAVVLRAIWLDRRLPWFGPGAEPADSAEPAPAGGRRMFRSLYISLVYGAFLFSGLVAPFSFGLGYVWVDTFTPQNIAYSIMNEFPVSQVMAAGAVGLYLLMDRKRPPGMNMVTALVIVMACWVTFTTFNDPVAPEDAFGKWNWAIKTIVFSAFMPAMFRSRVQIESFLQIYVFSLAGQILPFAGKTILTGGKYGVSTAWWRAIPAWRRARIWQRCACC